MSIGGLLRVTAVLCALTLTACAAPKIKMPMTTVVGVGMTSADIFSQQFLVKMHVQNPNDEPLPIKGIDYKIFLEGDHFAEGSSFKPFMVPASGETDYDMNVHTTFMSSIGRLLSRLNGRTQVQYIIEGALVTDISGAKKIPFKDGGAVELKVQK